MAGDCFQFALSPSQLTLNSLGTCVNKIGRACERLVTYGPRTSQYSVQNFPSRVDDYLDVRTNSDVSFRRGSHKEIGEEDKALEVT